MFELMRKEIVTEIDGTEIEDDYVVYTYATEEEAEHEALELNASIDWDEQDALGIYLNWWVREA